jgi:hypothetical protein
MIFATFFKYFSAPCEVRISTMETHSVPVHYYVTLTNVARLSESKYRLKFVTPAGHILTMIFEDDANKADLFIPVHRMYHETDITQKPHFLFI